ncbi:MAG: D-alanine--D-alanine ligase [Acidobacteria bacterium]|nr:D-alanine--D-alanine ligase [Acidobacteriota bacterium]
MKSSEDGAVQRRVEVGVIFGGRSGEHEISLRSAESVISALDPAKYVITPIAIERDGRWKTANDDTLLNPFEVMEKGDQPVALLGDPTRKGLALLSADLTCATMKPLDVVFPVLHGTYGEDGTIQGLLEMADIPYVGCGVLASSTGMDKVIMKLLFEEAGLDGVQFITVLRAHWEADQDEIELRIMAEIGFPCFVKPANLGSSVGISRANNREELRRGLALAARYDRKLIVEQGVDAREIEVSVLGNDQPIASLPGEIVTPSASFYDYQTKYLDASGALLVVPVDLEPELLRRIQGDAIRAFQAIDGSGLARVDFFLERGTDRLLINEINTMPGFTSISMYPKLWEATGIPYGSLIDRLIELAFERHRDKSRNLTAFDRT